MLSNGCSLIEIQWIFYQKRNFSLVMHYVLLLLMFVENHRTELKKKIEADDLNSDLDIMDLFSVDTYKWLM